MCFKWIFLVCPCDILNRTHFVRFEIINDIFDLDIKSWMTFHQIWRPSCSGLEFPGSQSGLTRQIYPLALVPGQIYPPGQMHWYLATVSPDFPFLVGPFWTHQLHLIWYLIYWFTRFNFFGPFSNFFEHTYQLHQYLAIVTTTDLPQKISRKG